jgi:uncharacterized protein (TIGR02599 family)
MIPETLKTKMVVEKAQDGFTLAELLVASAILALLVVLLLTMVNQTSKTWKSTSGKIEEFRGARDAFDTITRRMGQATLNTYLDYDNPAIPKAYMRQSELRFLSGPTTTILSSLTSLSNVPTMSVFFQAPNGFSTNSSNSILQNALNTWGYFVEYASDSNSIPDPVKKKGYILRNRYRLMELMEPTESLSVYNYTSGNRNYTNVDWISNSMALTTNRPAHVLAENVIALIILPKLSPTDISNWNSRGSNYSAVSLAPNFTYDSSQNLNSNPIDANLNTHHQLPPVIQVTLVAVDETSAVRFADTYSNLMNKYSSFNLFQNASNLPTDLTTLGTFLSGNQMNYRIFTTDVMIKGAKWSGSQTN